MTPITDQLRAMKVGEEALFPQYHRAQQLSATVARLKPYGYRFTLKKTREGLWVMRVPNQTIFDLL